MRSPYPVRQIDDRICDKKRQKKNAKRESKWKGNK